MKRVFGWSMALVFVVVLIPVAIVNVLSVPRSESEAPDVERLVGLPDGSEQRLGDLLEVWAGGGEADAEERVAAPDADASPAEPGASDTPTIERGTSDQGSMQAVLDQLLVENDDPPDGSQPFRLAEWHRRQGQLDDAKAIYLALPASHRNWARAQRRLAWDCFAQADDEPARGVPFANASVAADPLDGNAWQDLARVYAATLGLPVD